MINNLTLTRFQGFGKEVSIDLRPLTLIFGPNASGKSSIVRSLLLAKQSLAPNRNSVLTQSGFVYEGESASLASFANVVYKHVEDSNFILQLTINKFDELLNTRLTSGFNRANDRATGIQSRKETSLESLIEKITASWQVTQKIPHAKYSVRVDFKGISEPLTLNFVLQKSEENTKTLLSYDFKIEGIETLVKVIKSDLADARPEELLLRQIFDEEPLDKFDDMSRINESVFKQVDAEVAEFDQIVGDMKFIMSGNFVRIQMKGDRRSLIAAKLARILDFVHFSTARNLSKVKHIGPLREISQRITYAAGTIANFGDEDEDVPDNPKNSEISAWLSKLTDGRYSYGPVELYAEKVRFLGALKAEVLIDNHTGTPVTFQDVGVGLSQCLPILGLLSSASARKGQTLLIEQPELHLHPKMQANLVDLFIDFVSNKDDSRTIVSETHSEAMLLRIQKRIREKTLDPNDVQIIYVDQSPRDSLDGESEGNFAFPLPIDENGEFLMPMPNSFSSLRFEDLL